MSIFFQSSYKKLGLAMAALLFLCCFAATAWGANTQIVSVSPATQNVVTGASFDVTIVYDHDDPATTTGIGFAVYYDSSQLTYSSYSNFLNEGGIQITPTEGADTNDDDGNANTDRKVTMAWNDSTISWPSSFPSNLVILNFNARNDATAGNTPINLYVNSPGANDNGSQSTQVNNGTVTILEAPKVTNATAPDGSYTSGDTIDITTTWSEAVNVDTTNGTPTIALNTGGTAAYVSGTGTSTLVFQYTVGANDDVADLEHTGFALNGATIVGASSGLNASASPLPTSGAAGSLSANVDIILDTTAPTVSISTPAGAENVNSSSYQFSGAAADAGTGMSGVQNVQVRVDGGVWVNATYSNGSWSHTFTELSDGAHTFDAKATDGVDLQSTVASSATVTVDTVDPTVAITDPTSPVYTPSDSYNVQGTTADTGTGVAHVDVREVGGDWNQVTPAAGSWSYNATSLAEGEHSFEVRATDNAGNQSTVDTSAKVTVDQTPPTVAGVQFSGADTYYGPETVNITVTFDEPMDSNVDPTITYSGGSSGAFAVNSWTDNQTLTASTTLVNADEGVNSLTINGAQDLAGNSMSNYDDPSAFTVDVTDPTFVVNTQTQTVASSSIGITGTVADATPYTVEVSTDGGTTWNAFSAPAEWTYNSNLALGANTFDFRATDIVGNRTVAGQVVITYYPAISFQVDGVSYASGSTITVYSVGDDIDAAITVQGGSGAAPSGSYAGYSWQLNPGTAGSLSTATGQSSTFVATTNQSGTEALTVTDAVPTQDYVGTLTIDVIAFNLGGPDYILVDEPIVYTTTGSSNVAWSLAAPLTMTVSNVDVGTSTTVTAGTAGPFTLTAYAGDLDLTATKAVTAVNAIDVNAIGGATALQESNTSQRFVATGGTGAYNWTASGGNTIDAQGVLTPDTAASGVRTVTVTATDQVTGFTGSTTVTVTEDFAMTGVPTATMSQATSSIGVTGGSGSATWQTDKGSITNAGVFTAPTVNSTVAPASTTATITATDATYGYTDTAMVVVYGNVGLQNPPTGTVVVPSGSASRTYTATGGDGVYDWTVTGPDNYNQSHLNRQSFAFTAPTTGAFAGKYTVTVDDGLGLGDPATFNVYVPVKLVPVDDVTGMNRVSPVFTDGEDYGLWAKGVAAGTDVTVTVAQSPPRGATYSSVVTIGGDSMAVPQSNPFTITAENPGTVLITARATDDTGENFVGRLFATVIGTSTISGTVSDVPGDLTATVQMQRPAGRIPFEPSAYSATTALGGGTYSIPDVPYGVYDIRVVTEETSTWLGYVGTPRRLLVDDPTETVNLSTSVVAASQGYTVSVGLGGDYNPGDTYHIGVREADTGNVIVAGTENTTPVGGLLAGGTYEVGIIAAGYEPFFAKWNVPNDDMDTTTADVVELTATLNADAGFDPDPPRVLTRIKRGPDGFRLVVNTVNFGGAAFTAEVIDDGNDANTGDVTGQFSNPGGGDTWVFNWNVGDAGRPYSDLSSTADGDAYTVVFEFDAGGNLVRRFVARFYHENQEGNFTQFLSLLPPGQRGIQRGYSQLYGVEQIPEVVEESRVFNPFDGATFQTSLVAADGQSYSVDVVIPPLAGDDFDLLKVDMYDSGNNNLNYDAARDTYNIPANAGAMYLTESLKAEFEYFEFGGSALAQGVSMRLILVSGDPTRDGALVRYNPYTRPGPAGRVADAPAIRLPLFFNPDAPFFSRFNNRPENARGSLRIRVNERGDGRPDQFVPQRIDFAFDPTAVGLAYIETTHLSSFGAGTTGGGGGMVIVDDDDDCFIRSATPSNGTARAAGVVFILALAAAASLFARRRNN